MTYTRQYITAKHRIFLAAQLVCFWIVLAEILGSRLIYDAALNLVGPSTEYHDPMIEGPTVELGLDGRYYAKIGSKVWVRYTIVRHKQNGSCTLNVWRYVEEIDGPQAGTVHLVDYTDLQFVGDDKPFRPRWPQDGFIIGAPDLAGFLTVPPGAQTQELSFFVKARYYCNLLDYVFPRYIQGGLKPNETARVNLLVHK